MAADQERKGLHRMLVAKGWDDEGARRAVLARYPLDSKRPDSAVLEKAIKDRSVRVEWELQRSINPDEYLTNLIDSTLRYYHECAAAEGDIYYTQRYQNILASAEPEADSGYLESSMNAIDPLLTGSKNSVGTTVTDMEIAESLRSSGSASSAALGRLGLWAGGLPVAGMTLMTGILFLLAMDVSLDPETGAKKLAEMRTILADMLLLVERTQIFGGIILALGLSAWMYSNRKAAGKMVTSSSWKAHWAWTGWFVPGLNLYVPYAVVKNSAQIYRSVARGSRTLGSAGKVGNPAVNWWTLFLSGIALKFGVEFGIYLTGANPLNFTWATWILGSVYVLAAVCWIGALVAGFRTVKEMAALRESAHVTIVKRKVGNNL